MPAEEKLYAPGTLTEESIVAGRLAVKMRSLEKDCNVTIEYKGIQRGRLIVITGDEDDVKQAANSLQEAMRVPAAPSRNQWPRADRPSGYAWGQPKNVLLRSNQDPNGTAITTSSAPSAFDVFASYADKNSCSTPAWMNETSPTPRASASTLRHSTRGNASHDRPSGWECDIPTGGSNWVRSDEYHTGTSGWLSHDHRRLDGDTWDAAARSRSRASDNFKASGWESTTSPMTLLVSSCDNNISSNNRRSHPTTVNQTSQSSMTNNATCDSNHRPAHKSSFVSSQIAGCLSPGNLSYGPTSQTNEAPPKVEQSMKAYIFRKFKICTDLDTPQEAELVERIKKMADNAPDGSCFKLSLRKKNGVLIVAKDHSTLMTLVAGFQHLEREVTSWVLGRNLPQRTIEGDPIIYEVSTSTNRKQKESHATATSKNDSSGPSTHESFQQAKANQANVQTITKEMLVVANNDAHKPSASEAKVHAQMAGSIAEASKKDDPWVKQSTCASDKQGQDNLQSDDDSRNSSWIIKQEDDISQKAGRRVTNNPWVTNTDETMSPSDNAGWVNGAYEATNLLSEVEHGIQKISLSESMLTIF
ncbi:hypothetical protein SeMB42_g03229 [Synchytrium endobioticum]|uniref:K Homology domain-containing protein n=1 Tax=Synchytrium endobioticum TaxID=286115 RepID=A0A507CTV0_9FUNG|nr:hypothetical protein SeLEV6574_g05519 [Synchytrium endobioticum]TPX47712.1 hypothetical protein SeMB42_g03229 [Synchytrium endobioticum]